MSSVCSAGCCSGRTAAPRRLAFGDTLAALVAAAAVAAVGGEEATQLGRGRPADDVGALAGTAKPIVRVWASDGSCVERGPAAVAEELEEGMRGGVEAPWNGCGNPQGPCIDGVRK